MDAKALAKSKRAHSQHLNKKHNRNPSAKAPLASPSGTDDAKKPSGKQLPEKTQKFRGSKPLPSNWDRYDEEDDSALDDPSVKNTSQTVDLVPKSKGADYRYLISEAESQSVSNLHLDSSPQFDDVLTDFYGGFGCMLSAKGQGIQLRMQDENFVVEDEATTSNEASFLSLDLHHLAEQLGKIDLARRLFIEPEMLSPEWCTDKPQIGSSESNQVVEEVKTTSNENSPKSHHVTDKEEKEIDDIFSSNNRAITVESSMHYSRAEKATSAFEAAAVTAELDKLLDSFTDALSQPSTIGPNMSRPSSASPDLNSALDDLFEETSSSYLSRETASVRFDPAETLRNSSVLSKPSVVAANFDDDLDDLLKETSGRRNQKSALQSREVTMSVHANTLSSSSSISSKSKALDDFDAWFDTV